MKKQILSLFSLSAFLILSGCSDIESYVDEKIWQDSQILEDQDYQEFQRLSNENLLDANGIYNELIQAEEDESKPSGQIHITFAENAFFEPNYFLDAEHASLINTQNCYLNPGESVYVSTPSPQNPNTNKYLFSRFRVMAYEDGKRQDTELSFTNDGDNLVMTIPPDCPWTELSIEPLGEYQNRIVSLKDYYIDNNGNEIELNGVWKITSEDSGEDVTTAGTTAEISPITSYTVSYDYGRYMDEYYFGCSEPDSFTLNTDKNEVEFYKATALSENESYSVGLRPYISLKLTNNEANFIHNTISAVTKSNDIIKFISVNDNEQKVSGDKEQFFYQLKCGDRIVIRIGSDYKVTADELTIDTFRAAVKEGYEYAFTIPEILETKLDIVISKNTATLGDYQKKFLQNAVITVCDSQGSALETGDEVDDFAVVTVSITPASGYYITGKKVSDGVYQDKMKYSKYVEQIDSIIDEHPVKKLCHITLETSDSYGTCVYKLDGKAVEGDIELRPEQTLKLEYTLTDSDYEIVRNSGSVRAAIEDVFSKNKLTVAIDITEDMDGGTIRRDQYIQIKKK